ncbi:MAG: hypothetical protein Q4A01_07600 [Coriobacteriales bacterium]|nr:hypothetical protein [Coriobacteriales bacterium]
MKVTRRAFLESAGALATTLALTACGGSKPDATEQQADSAKPEDKTTQNTAKVTPPDKRTYWACVDKTIHDVDEDGDVTDKHWTATLDDHGNVVAAENDNGTSHVFEVDEHGFLTRNTQTDDSGSDDYAVSYECDDKGNPVTCTVEGDEAEFFVEPYILEITYNELGDIATLEYDRKESGTTITQEFDEYGVNTTDGPGISTYDDRNEQGLPNSLDRGSFKEAYEYDDAGNLVHFTRTFDSGITQERTFKYVQVDDPSLAVRLGSHLWGAVSSVNDLLGPKANTVDPAFTHLWGY